jgi:hypothetical protein
MTARIVAASTAKNDSPRPSQNAWKTNPAALG